MLTRNFFLLEEVVDVPQPIAFVQKIIDQHCTAVEGLDCTDLCAQRRIAGEFLDRESAHIRMEDALGMNRLRHCVRHDRAAQHLAERDAHLLSQCSRNHHMTRDSVLLRNLLHQPTVHDIRIEGQHQVAGRSCVSAACSLRCALSRVRRICGFVLNGALITMERFFVSVVGMCISTAMTRIVPSFLFDAQKALTLQQLLDQAAALQRPSRSGRP